MCVSGGGRSEVCPALGSGRFFLSVVPTTAAKKKVLNPDQKMDFFAPAKVG